MTKLLCYLKGIYEDKFIAHHSNKGDYLGTDLDFTEKGIFQVSMINYIREIFDDYPKPITKSTHTPHNENLFKVHNENKEKFLPDDQAIQYH